MREIHIGMFQVLLTHETSLTMMYNIPFGHHNNMELLDFHMYVGNITAKIDAMKEE